MKVAVQNLPFQGGNQLVVPVWATAQQAAVILGEEPNPGACDECGGWLRDRRMLSGEPLYDDLDVADKAAGRWAAGLLSDDSLLLVCGESQVRFCRRCVRTLAVWLLRFTREVHA